jgi:hypothetical protein
MATQADVRRIALSLPGTVETPNHFAFSVRNKGKLKGFVWVWMERVHPKKARGRDRRETPLLRTRTERLTPWASATSWSCCSPSPERR